MNLPEIFDEVSKKMRLDLRMTREAIEHRGLKGEAFENTFREFLRQYIPRSLDVSTGFLIDPTGKISKQLDVIISDAAKTPIFYYSGSIRVIPVECAYAVIEVKANLNTCELNRAFENMKSVRALKKTAYAPSAGDVRNLRKLYGQVCEIWPINYYIFAYDSIGLKTLANHIIRKHQADKLPCHSRIDAVCVLDKGVICNRRADGKIDALPEPGSEIIYNLTSRSLLLFYELVSRYFNQAGMPNFQINDYLGDIRFDMRYEKIIEQLKYLSDPKAVTAMKRFGITPENAYGISIPNLRKIAKEIGKDHSLAQGLWASGIREAMILASMIDDPKIVTEEQMEKWVSDFTYWEICDQCCMNLFEKTEFAYQKCFQWASREEEFVKRAGFVLMARLAVSDKKAADEKFEEFLPVIKSGSTDERNYVKKAVKWALRQIGKRNLCLNAKAMETAREIQKIDSKSARWIASDAIRELTSAAVQDRLQSKLKK